MIDFTHAIYDDDGLIVRKLRMSKSEFEWFIKEHPRTDIRKLETTKTLKPTQADLFNTALERVGESLF